MMRRILRFIYQLIIIVISKKRHIKISIHSLFNTRTYLEGYNVINKGSVISGSRIGKGTYIAMNSRLINSKIGRFCSIAPDVSVIVGDHPTRHISTSPSFFSLLKQNGLVYTDKKAYNEILPETIIGNDVWIGESVKIMGGVRIGDGAILGTGAVVVKDVPPYAIVGGVPAKIIRYRFEKDIINKLLEIQWWNCSDERLRSNIQYFQTEDITIEKLNELENKLKA